jgi:hypothetical protein
MDQIRIYKVSCDEAYMMDEVGEGYSLSPWGEDTPYYAGGDDGGTDYALPRGVEVGQMVSGETALYEGDFHCSIVEHNGQPAIIRADWSFHALKTINPDSDDPSDWAAFEVVL